MHRILLAGFLVLGAGPAWAAGRTAPPPPSGEVIHLFGPDGVWTNILPASPAHSSAAAPPSTAPAAGPSAAGTPSATVANAPAAALSADNAASGGTAPAAAGPSAPSAAYPEPTLGGLLHQMFIVGDPGRGPGFSTGRPGSN